jgi:hypothetical protein
MKNVADKICREKTRILISMNVFRKSCRLWDNNNNTAQQKKNFLVPWFLGLFLGLFGPLIQKITLDRPHQL